MVLFIFFNFAQFAILVHLSILVFVFSGMKGSLSHAFVVCASWQNPLNYRRRVLNARVSNFGVVIRRRLDYFVVSERFLSNVCDSEIRHKVKGSDHCPVMLLLAL